MGVHGGNGDEKAKKRILDLIQELKVVTERELKVRLEKEFFPWVTGRVLDALCRNGLRSYGYKGRRRIGKGVPERFFVLKGTPYSEVESIIQLKRRLSADVNLVLTGEAPAGYHAQDLFLECFEGLGFVVHGTDVSEFGGRKVSRVEGKEPPNLEFVVEKDDVIYGVEVKNWLKYESGNVGEVKAKVGLAVELGVVPFFIGRYVDRSTIYTEIYCKGGLAYPYGELLVPTTFSSLAERAKALLGYPMLAVDVLPDYKVRWVEKLHRDFVGRKKA